MTVMNLLCQIHTFRSAVLQMVECFNRVHSNKKFMIFHCTPFQQHGLRSHFDALIMVDDS